MGFLKTLFGGTSSNRAPQKIEFTSIGHSVLHHYKPYITDKESAKKAALSVLWHGQSQFIDGPNGTIIRAADSGIAMPPRLKSFSESFYNPNNGTVNGDVVNITYGLTRTIDDQVIQIETVYSIAEAIVEKYNL